MSNQTIVNGPSNGSGRTRPAGDAPGSARKVVGNAADVVHDVIELVELQLKLLFADLGGAGRRAILPIVMMVVGVCLLLGLIPVLVAGLAEAFVAFDLLSRWLAMFAAAACAGILSAALLAVGWRRLRSGLGELASSREELQRNVAWLKETIRRGGTTTKA